MRFEDFNLHKDVLFGVKAAGFKECMTVQEKVLSQTLSGRDVMVQSKTGSGKTAAFVLTFLEEYLRRKEQGLDSKCLIVAPTRELAQQIAGDAKILSSGIKGFRIGCFYGGVGYESQHKKLAAGCELCIGTPGRLIEFLKNKRLDGKQITSFVIDEADRLFDMGFYPDIKQMFKLLNDRTERQTMLFSATLEMRVRELAWEFMNEPAEIDLEPDSVTVDEITQELYHVAKSDKFYLFLQLLAVSKPQSAIVFTNSRFMANEVAVRLKLNGYSADHLSGDMTQVMRDKALTNLKTGKTTILVATDVAARGLQIDDLPLVVNYDIPEDYENYVHRIGRTARAGKSGRAITLADEEFVYGLEAIENFIKMKIPVIWPNNLPEIEDLSLGKSWKSFQEKPVRKKPVQKKSVQRNVPDVSVKPKKPLSEMSEEERLEYYKKKYGFVPKDEPKSEQRVASDKEQKPVKKPLGVKAIPLRVLFLGSICIVLYGITLIPIVFFRLLHLKRLSDGLAFGVSKFCSALALFLSGADVKVFGDTQTVKDLVKNKIPVCFILNHTSFLDVPVLYTTLGINAGFIAKNEYKYFPVLNLMIILMNSIFLKRDDINHSKRAIRKGVKNIQNGIPMAIFPEGTRSKTGEIARFKRGSFRLATESGAVIIPIALKNLRKCCEDRERTFQKKQVCYMFVGTPVQAPDSSQREEVEKVAQNVENQIRDYYRNLGTKYHA